MLRIFNCLILCLAIGILSGCTKSDLNEAQKYARKSASNYEQAVSAYQRLIAQGGDTNGLRFELGRLYYEHGNFDQAVKELKNTAAAQANKFLAISYYRLGNFTDALEAFNKQTEGDDEYLYYRGLTCEKLNLFDTALGIYRKIKGKDFSALAAERSREINKESALNIKNIDPQVEKIIREAPSEDKYPQAGALILSADEKTELTAQNTEVDHLRYLIKILNERGKEDFAETQIEYDSTYEKVELEFARIIKADGTIVEVGSRHIRDVSKYLNFPLYSNVRAFIISFPEIAQGVCIEYKLKIYRNSMVNKKDFVSRYPLQSAEPIVAADFSIEAPEGKKLNFKFINEWYNNFAAELKPRIEKKDGRLIYRWQFKDIPEILPESNMPPNVEVNPTVLISTFNSWQEIYDWWWPLARDKIKADAAIKAKVKELTSGLNSGEEKARAIHNFCAKDIRYVAIEYGDAGYEPHFAVDVFRNKYGDCKDQAILLVTMLREAGLESWPVLIATKDYYNMNKDFPSMLFNHCIAAVSIKDKLVFLDPTAETCSFGDLPGGDQGREVLLVKDNGYQIASTPRFPPQHNTVRQRAIININEKESLAAKKTIFTFGIYDQGQRYWLLYSTPELVREALQEKIQEISIGALLERYTADNLNDLNNPVVLSYEFTGPEYFTAAGALRIMPQLASIDSSLAAKHKRKYPIDFGMLDVQEYEFEFNLPANLSVEYLPGNVVEDSPWLKFSAEYTRDGNKIIFRQREEFKQARISQEEYPDFKFFFENLGKKVKQRIVLRKKAE